jgi:hypothetical protein
MQELNASRSDTARTGHHEVLFTLQKHDWRAVCEAVCRGVQHDSASWVLHLYIGAPANEIVSGDCGSRDAAIALADRWKGTMLAKGWD